MAYAVEITRPTKGQWNIDTAAVAGDGAQVIWAGRAEYVDDPVFLARYATGDVGATQSKTALVEKSRVVNGMIFLPRATVHELVQIGDRVRIESPTGTELRGTIEGLQRTGFIAFLVTDTPQFVPVA